MNIIRTAPCLKKVKDYYYKKAKQQNYPARSVYKLEEAQKKYHFMKKSHKVLDLGSYPGSWSLYAAREVGPGGMVVAVDIEKGGTLRQPGEAEIQSIVGDVHSPDTLGRILRIAPLYDVVLSDMAPRTTGDRLTDHMRSVGLARKALAIAVEVLGRGGSLYCKVFQGEEFPLFVDEMGMFFREARTIKPHSSRSESREMFVLGVGFQNRSGTP